MNKQNEKLILFRLKTKKDPETYGQVYDLYVERIFRFIYFKVSSKEDAQDITSEVFLKAWNYINEDKEIKSLSGLLYRISRNLVIDFYRAKAKQNEYFSNNIEIESEKSNEDVADDVHKRIEVQKIIVNLNKLKQEYKEVITLRFIDGFRLTEIAEILGKGQVATRVLLHRALNKLKEISEK